MAMQWVLAAAAALVLSAASAFELVAFQGVDRSHEKPEFFKTTQELSTRTLKGKALVPYVSDDVGEAVRSRKSQAVMEFVHVHKCGGQTFNRVVPFLLCGGETVKVKNATQPHWLEAKIKKCEDETCCLVRPKPSLPAAFAAREKTVRYASAREEFSAYEMPWRDEGGSDVRKLTMIRKPYDRWTSEMLYACRLRGEKPRRVAEAFNFSATRKSVARNRIAQGLVPPVALGKSGLTGDALTGSALEAARGALRSFAFVGVVEHYDRSMCLFARTFLPKTRPICDLCCDHTPHVPHVNAEAAEECDGSVYTEEDRALYDETHAVDRQVYDIALRIFERRWTIAQDHRWGADPDLCRCTFLHHDEHHDDASSSSSPQRDDPALSSAALSSGCCQGGIASVTTVDAAGNATTTTTTALRRGEGNDDEASSSAEEDDGDATR